MSCLNWIVGSRFVALLVVISWLTNQAHAGLIVSVEAPGVQATSVVGATTETFDSGAVSGVLGAYTNMLVLSPAVFSGVYGGAFGTHYGAVFDGLAGIELNAPQKYFGMWWAAGDNDNGIAFFDNGTLLGSYFMASFTAALPPAYFGNPNTGQNPDEPYAYLNFTTTENSNITHVFFFNGANSLFESDNHSVFDQPIRPPGTILVPEPSGFGALAIVVGSAALRRRRRSC